MSLPSDLRSINYSLLQQYAWFTSAPIWMTDLNSNGSIIESNHLLNLFNWLSWPYLPGPLSSLGTRFRKLFSVCAKPGIRAVWWKSGMITKQFLSSYSRPVNSMVTLDYTFKPPPALFLFICKSEEARWIQAVFSLASGKKSSKKDRLSHKHSLYA